MHRKILNLLFLLPVLGALIFFAAWSPPSSTGPASPGSACDIPTDDALLPDQLMPTGGPYVDPQPAVDKAVAIARGYGVPDPYVLGVRFTTYCDSMLVNGMPLGTYVNRDREVYEVSIEHFGGDMIINHGPELVAGPFLHSFYISDATTGDLLTWGANDFDSVSDSGVSDSGSITRR
jgi:hypothetical protein